MAPNVKDGRVHLHPERPNGGWSAASHRLCEPIYTRRRGTHVDPLPVAERAAAIGLTCIGDWVDNRSGHRIPAYIETTEAERVRT